MTKGTGSATMLDDYVVVCLHTYAISSENAQLEPTRGRVGASVTSACRKVNTNAMRHAGRVGSDSWYRFPDTLLQCRTRLRCRRDQAVTARCHLETDTAN